MFKASLNQLLVPIDFSPASKQAFLYAAGLAHSLQAKLTLLHVHKPGGFEPFVPVLMQQALLANKEEEALEHFAAMELELPAEYLGTVELDIEMAVGPVLEQIQLCQERIEADLIVMGMRGGNRPFQKLWGSNTTRLIQQTDCPVLAVPEHISFEGINKMVYATNFEQGDIRAVNYLVQLSQILQAKFHCVHIDLHQDGNHALKSNILQEAYAHEVVMDQLEVQAIDGDSVSEGLNTYLAEGEQVILAMLTHDRGLWERLFQSSTTKAFAKQAKVPVLALQEAWIHAKPLPSSNHHHL
ncbi:MAG: universal stress protein [Bacteroidota bacterium]